MKSDVSLFPFGNVGTTSAVPRTAAAAAEEQRGVRVQRGACLSPPLGRRLQHGAATRVQVPPRVPLSPTASAPGLGPGPGHGLVPSICWEGLPPLFFPFPCRAAASTCIIQIAADVAPGRPLNQQIPPCSSLTPPNFFSYLSVLPACSYCCLFAQVLPLCPSCGRRSLGGCLTAES